VEGHPLADSRMVSVGEEKNVSVMGLRDGWLDLEILFKAEKPALFMRYPVETISQSEGGFEKVYQGSCLLLAWDVQLAPGQTFETAVVTQLKGRRS